MMHRNRGGAEVSMHHSTPHLCLEEAGMWCLTITKNYSTWFIYKEIHSRAVIFHMVHA